MADPQHTKYSILHARGVVLDDDSIDYIVENMRRGVLDAEYFFGTLGEASLHFFCSDNLDRIGYAPEFNGINLPVRYLNTLAARLDDAHLRIQELTETIGGDETAKCIDAEMWFYIAGLEEAVHHFQHIGHPRLSADIGADGMDYRLLSELGKVLCDVEVEAREMVDRILVSLGGFAIWSEYDESLKALYPDRYRLSWKEQLQIEGKTR